LFDPLRTFLQGVLDRVFFRTRYDSAQVLEAVGAELASALTRDHIARLVRNGIQGAIPNTCTRLFVGSTDEGLEEGGGGMLGSAAICWSRRTWSASSGRAACSRPSTRRRATQIRRRPSGRATRSPPSMPRWRCRCTCTTSWLAC